MNVERLKKDLEKAYKDPKVALLLEAERLSGWVKGVLDFRNTSETGIRRELVITRNRVRTINEKLKDLKPPKAGEADKTQIEG